MEQKQIENITEESQKMLENYHNQEPQQLPTISEYSKIKLKEGFNFLGRKFEQGAQRLSLEKQLLELKTKQTILAKDIGQTVIQKVQLGESIIIPDEMLVKAQQILAQKEVIEEEIKNGKC